MFFTRWIHSTDLGWRRWRPWWRRRAACWGRRTTSCPAGWCRGWRGCPPGTLSPCSPWRSRRTRTCRGKCGAELQTMVCEDFTITERAPCLFALSHLRHYCTKTLNEHLNAVSICEIGTLSTGAIILRECFKCRSSRRLQPGKGPRAFVIVKSSQTIVWSYTRETRDGDSNQ